jgi:CRISPR-associated protein Cas2
MSMTVVVTRDVADRTRGFLASCMLEIAPGVYTAPDLNAGVRRRIWEVLSDWFQPGQGSIIMTWQDNRELSGQGLLTLGQPVQQFTVYDGLVLIRKTLSMGSELDRS